MKKKILICDDEENTRNLLEYVLNDKGYKVVGSDSILRALNVLENEHIDIIITDMVLGNESGMDLLKKVKKTGMNIPVIFLTAYGTIQNAVQAMTAGAFYYLLKPINYDELLAVLKQSENQLEVENQNIYLKEEVSRLRNESDVFIAQSAGMKTLISQAKKIAETDTTVLITGESGTGKEVLANYIHREGHRTEKTFVVVNCAAINENLLESELFGHEKGSFTGAIKTKIGKFEIADGGTIFLDEIGDLPLSLQAKLLRVLENGEIDRVGSINKIIVDVRIIAATNKDLQKAVKDGSFREDLYYRLTVVPMKVPPLREHRDDIRPLIEHFQSVYEKMRGKKISINAHCFEYLERYQWPGNIRELKNLVERLSILYDEISVDELPEEIVQAGVNADLKKLPLANLSLKNIEKEAIRQTLIAVKGNRRKAAEILEITRQTLYSKIKDYAL